MFNYVAGISVESSIEGGSLFHNDIDGPTLLSLTELEQYREWAELSAIGS
jgi:hypothetical protein